MAQGWGVTNVTVRYVAGDATWEITMDPARVDILVFNQERFRRINEVIGAALPASNHIQPDGRPVGGALPPEEVARRIGLRGQPRYVGPREEGTSHDPLCIHSEDCTWWCIEEHEE
jgi:hypothetical protein